MFDDYDIEQVFKELVVYCNDGVLMRIFDFYSILFEDFQCLKSDYEEE